jgi:hypothetical protein
MNLVLSRTTFVFVVLVKPNCMNFLFHRLFPQAHCSLQVHSTLLVAEDGLVEYAIGSGIFSNFFSSVLQLLFYSYYHHHHYYLCFHLYAEYLQFVLHVMLFRQLNMFLYFTLALLVACVLCPVELVF